MPSKNGEGSLKDLYNVLAQNRFGLIGFCLSILQVVVHGSWLGFITFLAADGTAENLTSDDWQMWLISALIILGALLTAVSLFLCLYGAIHGKPRILAIIGLCLSFFVGALTTFTLILNALAPE